MSHDKLKLIIHQGSDLFLRHTWQTKNGGGVDLRGCDVVMQVKRRAGKDEPVLLEASTFNGYITITKPEAGEMEINVPASVTRELDFKEGEYDLIVIFPTTPQRVVRLLSGRAFLSEGVTLSWTA